MYSYWSFIDKIQTCGTSADVASAVGNLMVANIVMFNTLKRINKDLELDFKYDLFKAMYCEDLDEFFSLEGMSSKLDEKELQGEIHKVLAYKKRTEGEDEVALNRLVEDINKMVGDEFDQEELTRAIARGLKKAIKKKERK